MMDFQILYWNMVAFLLILLLSGVSILLIYKTCITSQPLLTAESIALIYLFPYFVRNCWGRNRTSDTRLLRPISFHCCTQRYLFHAIADPFMYHQNQSAFSFCLAFVMVFPSIIRIYTLAIFTLETFNSLLLCLFNIWRIFRTAPFSLTMLPF